MKQLLALLSIFLLFSCNKKQDVSKGFQIPTDDPQALQQARQETKAAIKDTTLADGTRVVTVKVTISPTGTPPKDTVIVPPVDTSKRVTGIGINTLPWVPLEKLTMFSTVRLYVASGWIWRPNGLFVQPFFQAETEYAHGLDDYLMRAKSLGIDVLPCVNLTPDWYAGVSDGSGSNNYPPIKKGLSRTDPNSYKDYAEFWFQFVARYGSKKHPDSDLKIDVTPRWNNDVPNVKKSGLGLLKYVEINNEVDIWWLKGGEQYVTPAEHVAMLVAVMDAIKRADPNMKVVMAGLTGLDFTYLKEMDSEFKRRGKQWPDVVNCHYYTHEGNQYAKWPPTWWNSGATFPENDKGFPYINEVIKFCKSINRPLWMTEYGCDSRKESWMHIQGSKFGMSDEQAQGELIVRTMKAYKTAGVERSYMFFAADESDNSGLWQSCGLLTTKAKGYQEKQSFQIVKNYLTSIPKVREN